MSVQKLVAEADKLIEKGKVPEALAKLKSALSEEPLNQLVATKLANIHVQGGNALEAAKVYGGLAKRLSDAGKSSVAIAIFKQALELTPDDIALRFRYAVECEAVGKLGDAFLQGQIVLNYYLRRKKFFDASTILPMMARAQPKDEKIKLAWVEVMQLCQAEQKLIPLLVALCGPPGVVSPDFPVGGEPTALSPGLYDGLKKLVPFFPRDPKIAYAIAWCAYRRGRMKEFYHYLRECFRREPDFCLGILLFARVLADEKKLNEALFVYRYFKERMTADKSADMLTLNRLMEAFVEKNGWVKFIEDSGDLLDAASFVKSMTGIEQVVVKDEQAAVEEEQQVQKSATQSTDDRPPAEIELGSGDSPDAMEILTATGQSIQEVSRQKKAAPAGISEPMRIQAELIKATIEATVAGMGAPQQTVVQPIVLPPIQAGASDASNAGQTQATMVGGLSPEVIKQARDAAAKSVEAPAPAPLSNEVADAPHVEEETTGGLEGYSGESVEFTSLIKMGKNQDAALPDGSAAPTPIPTASPDDGATRVAVAAPEPEKTLVDVTAAENTVVRPMSAGELEPAELSPEEDLESGEGDTEEPKKKLFNPLDQAVLPGSGGESLKGPVLEERTQMFSPMDVLGAAKVMQNREIADVETKEIVIDGKFEKPAELELPEAAAAVPLEIREADKTKWRELNVDGEKTIEFSPVEAVGAGVASRRPRESAIPPAETKPAEAAPAADFTSGEATVILSRPSAEELESKEAPLFGGTAKVEIDPNTPVAKEEAPFGNTAKVEIDPGIPEAEPELKAEPTSEPASDGPAFMAIPEAVAGDKPGVAEEKVDLGDDLLEGPTRIFSQPTAADKTEHLIKEIKHDLKNKVSARLNIDMMMKKAERYTAKRNYYLARKALRHAQALGADEEIVKLRLREIRKLELPDGLYSATSSDQIEKKVDTSDVLERLELEFDLRTPEGEDSAELGALVEARIEGIFREHDPRTILDFGIGLHEMGLFRQAEVLFMRLVEEFPDHAFDAYYLAAVSKLSRRDYAGAASILKRLSSDTGKTDLEKIQIYYALGETFEKMRQRDRSMKFFKKVAELDANYRNIRHKLDE